MIYFKTKIKEEEYTETIDLCDGDTFKVKCHRGVWDHYLVIPAGLSKDDVGLDDPPLRVLNLRANSVFPIEEIEALQKIKTDLAITEVVPEAE